MSKVDKDRESLKYLGHDFQIKLLAQILVDRKFAYSVIDILDPNHFEGDYLKLIVIAIKDSYEGYDTIPDIQSIEARLLSSVKNDAARTFAIRELTFIKDASQTDAEWIQKKALAFFRQQELKKAVRSISGIIESGDLERYTECETIIKKAIEKGDEKDDGRDVTDDIDNVLSDDFRNPIPTGIKGLDEYMDGGLSKGELGVILAPFGVGKTTMVTKIANTAKNLGYNVLQIFFEDNPKIIQRKHYSCWTGIDLNNLNLHRESVKQIVNEKKAEKGVLKLKKFPSDGTTIPKIRQYIRKLIAQGFRPDMVLLDYIDCVQPSRHYDDVNVGEGAVMRQFESMLSELDLVGWTAIQGNRSSIGKDLVEADQIGGSIKKGQIGHFIVSIAKTLDQKKDGTANLAILKSRFGKDGVVFNGIIFNNASIQIEISEAVKAKTQSEHKSNVIKEENNYISSLFAAKDERSKAIEGTEEPPKEEPPQEPPVQQ